MSVAVCRLVTTAVLSKHEADGTWAGSSVVMLLALRPLGRDLQPLRRRKADL